MVRRRPRLVVCVLLAAVLTSAAAPPSGAAHTDGSGPSAETGRTGRLAACGEAPEVYFLLCLVYELISSAYVDPVETVILAEGAARGLGEVEPAPGRERTAPPCPLPAPEFEAVCRKIGTAADPNAAVRAAAARMVRYLGDRYSYLTTPERYRAVQSNINNVSRGSLGVGLALMDGDDPCEEVSAACRPVVFEVYPNSPAARAGLLAGDVLAGLDGPLADDLACRDLPRIDRFGPGEEVTVEVIRGGRTLALRAEAARLAIPAVRSRVVDGTIGYIRLDSFSSGAAGPFKKQLERLLESDITALVLDLRDNTGGYLQTTLDIAALFLEDQAMGGQQMHKGLVGSWSAAGDGIASDPALLPMAVAVNGGSASASEILTAALKGNGRAAVVGERTYGKAVGQRTWELKNGKGTSIGALSLTNFRLLGPHGSSFADGIPPDTPMNLPSCLHPDEAARRAASVLTGAG